MALTTGTYDSFFRYDEATKQIKFTDTTDYIGQGTAAADVTIVAKVVAPVSGTIYNNTNHGAPDIDPDVSRDSTITIPLPLDAGGLPELGLYTVTLQYKDTGGSPVTINEEKSITLSYASPVVDIDMTVDCITPLLSAIDQTAYTVNLVDPTIVRAFAIHYPPSLQLPDATGTATPLTTRTFYTVAEQTVEHSSSLTSTLTYDYGDDFYVIDEVTGADVIPVACDGDLCDIYCCFRAVWSRYESFKTTNTLRANEELAKFEQITSIAQLVGLAIRCGKSAHVSEYVTQILAIADCDAGCSCGDGTPQLVTGLAINGNDVVVAAGTGISVGSVTGGGTTTYTVSLSSANVTKLANMTNSIVAAGTNITVTPTSATVGGILTWTYTVDAADIVVQTLLAKVKMAFANGVVPVITIENQNEYGTTFEDTLVQTGGSEFVLNNNNGSSAAWLNNYANFTVDNFLASGAIDFYPSVDVINRITETQTNDLKVEIYGMTTTTFQMRFTNGAGQPVGGISLQDYPSLELIFKIQA